MRLPVSTITRMPLLFAAIVGCDQTQGNVVLWRQAQLDAASETIKLSEVLEAPAKEFHLELSADKAYELELHATSFVPKLLAAPLSDFTRFHEGWPTPNQAGTSSLTLEPMSTETWGIVVTSIDADAAGEFTLQVITK